MNIYNLSKYRKRKEISTRNLSEACGLSSNYIWRIENRKAELTSDIAQDISEHLGIAPRWLLDSPVLVTRQSVFDLLEKISVYTNGFESISDKGVISLKSEYSIVLEQIAQTRNNLIQKYTKGVDDPEKIKTLIRKMVEPEIEDWILKKPSSFSLGDSDDIIYTNNLKVKAVLDYANKRNISDFFLGIALGIDELDAADYVKRLRYDEVDISDNALASFFAKYDLSISTLLDDFSINSRDDLEHAFYALFMSKIGRFDIGRNGSFIFRDERIKNYIIENHNNLSFPIILEENS